MNFKKHAFTLVELIVVITILAILGTIAFMSFQGYSQNTRDSVRQSDLTNIVTFLKLYETKTGFFPEPSGPGLITYSGGLVWNQGTIGNSVITSINGLNSVPKDPLTENEYTYSILNTKKEFEIAAIFEGDSFALSSPNKFIEQTHAADNLGKAYIKGNYNKMVAKVSIGPVTYVLAVPTIIATEPGDLLEIIRDKKLVFHNFSNGPSSYSGATGYTASGSFDFNSSNSGAIVVYTGSITDLKTDQNLKTLADNLKLAYSGTDISTEGVYSEIASMDTSDTNVVKNLVGVIANNNLGTQVDLTQTPNNLYNLMFAYLDDNNLEIPRGFNNGVVEFSNMLYFVAKDGGPEITLFDKINPFFTTVNAGAGYPFGTLYSIDINGKVKSFGSYFDTNSFYGSKYVLYNNKLYFGNLNGGLYSIDSSNTILNEDSHYNVSNLIVYNNKLYFTASDGFIAIFTIDTESLVTKVVISNGGDWNNAGLVYNNELYFNGGTQDGIELNYIDSLGNVTARDLNPTGTGFPHSFTLYNGNLYFGATTSTTFNSGFIYTYKLLYINSSHIISEVPGTETTNGSISNIFVFNNKLYFLANTGAGYTLRYVDELNNITELTTVGTGIDSNNFTYKVYNNKLYFQTKIGTDYRFKYLDVNNNITEIDDTSLDHTQAIFDSPAIYNDHLYFVKKSGNNLYNIDSSNILNIDQRFTIDTGY